MPSYRDVPPFAFAGTLALLLLPAAALAAPEGKQSLKEVVAEIATSVKAVVEKADQPSVRIGFFAGSGLDDSNAGAGISALLAQELGDLANPKSVIEVQGNYFFIPDKGNPEIKVIELKVR